MDDRNLGLEMVRVTEAAALSCARWMGRGDAKGADQAAVDAMRRAFDSLNIYRKECGVQLEWQRTEGRREVLRGADPDEIRIRTLERIEAAELSKDEREKRLFYAQLYIGLNHAVEGDAVAAERHLRLATLNKWGPAAGYGPNYMWHVGRLHEQLLRTKPAAK